VENQVSLLGFSISTLSREHDRSPVINVKEIDAIQRVEGLPGAWPLDSARPRLVGCGPDGLPLEMYSYVQIRAGSDWVVVEPNLAVYRATARFLLALGIIYPPAIEWVVWHFIRPENDRLLAAILMPLPGIVLLAGAALVRWLGRSAAAKGPILRFSREDQQFQLYRIGRTLPRSDVIRLDLISGAWIRTRDSEFHSSEGSTELHLVVRLTSGALVSLPLLGTQGIVRSAERGLGQVAQTLSEISGVPLERIEESTSFFDPYKKRAHDSMSQGAS
jgi:hypothetical protein